MEPLPDARINQLLDRARFAHVAVISNGDPYVGPLSFVRYKDALYFRTAAGERIAALQLHPRAAVSIVEFDVGTGSWESVLVRGDVSFPGSDRPDDAVVVLFLEKYREYTSHLGSGPRLDTEDAALGWVGAPEVARDEAVVFRLMMREVAGRTSGRWMTPGTRPGRL
jgi:nitroimidazol reductase NimA-like FMN-containing flavoprotein (pyridoxamine 5'-phosphate oxidase superfamily)